MTKKAYLKSLLALGLTSAALAVSAQQTAKIYVDMGTRGHDVSKSMYGMFFEEINHAGDGGLYAEMLQNRGFEEQVLPSGMTYSNGRAVAPHSPNYWGLDYVDSWVAWDINTLKTKGWRFTSAGMKSTSDVVTLDEPLNANTPNALHIEISQKTSDKGRFNVINDGYWGVAVKADSTYKLRFYLRTSDYMGTVKAMLCDKHDKSIGEQDFTIIADGQWHEYTGVIKSSETVTDGNFRLQLSETGTVDIDYVSLFPTDTYKGRDNGLRRDIAETLEGLHPSFLRWPGGCIVEGITLENRVRWKETLGDPMTRRGEYSLWGYRSTYGLGMYEFLQMCEDMHMDGMFVANVGMSCSIRNGDFIDPSDTAALRPFRQDIEDAIEYAIGDPATNEWAARRAEAGHPAPFPLKYVELGNENGSDRYVKRFAYFYDYLKAKYPQITFINTMSWSDASLFKKTDMYDVHWYVTPDEFYNQATLFDTAPRGDYHIYAGEYAVNNGVGSGNMDAALAEAVFIGGMERNSDFVTMASYAPLLLNVNQPNWACDLIWYDNHRVMGRASYYVQQMFSANRPDYNVKTRLFSDAQNLNTSGRIAVGTWNTQAEFRNITVTTNDGSKTLYKSDFSGNIDEWTEDGGTWAVTDEGTLSQSANGTPCVDVLNSYDFSNSTIELEAKKTGGAEGFLVYIGLGNSDTKDGWRVNIGGWSNTKTSFEQVTNGSGTAKGTSTAMRLNNNQWYKIKLVGDETHSLKCYVDDKLVAEVELGEFINGRLQAFGGYDKKAGEIVVKVVNGTEKETTAEVVLGAQNIASSGKVITLSSASLADENSLDEPEKIYPEETSFDGFGGKFSYTFKPCSFTIFRVKADSTASDTLDIPQYQWNDTPVELDEVGKLRATALANLSALIEKGKALLVDGAKGASDLSASIASAETTGATGTIKDINTAVTNLQTAIDTYTKGLMNSANEKTSKLSNPNFSTMSNDGWNGSKPALEHNVGEFFNTTFDTYQNITGLQPGKYLIYIQGFYRNGSQDEASVKHTDGSEQLLAKLYAGSSETSVRSLYDFSFSFGSYKNYCDNREQSEKAFNTSGETYANYLIAEVDSDGRLRIGLRKNTAVGTDWTCFNNLRLFYIPVEATGIKGVGKNAVAPEDTYNLQGQRVSPDSDEPILISNGVKFVNKKK